MCSVDWAIIVYIALRVVTSAGLTSTSPSTQAHGVPQAPPGLLECGVCIRCTLLLLFQHSHEDVFDYRVQDNNNDNMLMQIDVRLRTSQ